MAVNPISDTSAVLDAIRLGWTMAEMRARYCAAPGTPFTRSNATSKPASATSAGETAIVRDPR
jgi:hypothetical protein